MVKRLFIVPQRLLPARLNSAETAEIRTSPNTFGSPTNRELASPNVSLGNHGVTLGIDASLW